MTFSELHFLDKFRFVELPWFLEKDTIWLVAWAHPSGGIVCEDDATGQRVRFFDGTGRAYGVIGNCEVIKVGEMAAEEIETKKQQATERNRPSGVEKFLQENQT